MLVDFSPASKVAIKYACGFAAQADAVLQILHVSDPDNKNDLESVRKSLQEFVNDTEGCSHPHEIIVEEGKFMERIPDLLANHGSELVIIATHGIKGIFHTMQGPEVLRLIQSVPIASLVIQEQTPREFKGFDHILFPMSPHKNIQTKIDQTAAVAKAFGSKVLIFVLTPVSGELDARLQSNLQQAEQAFEQQGIEYEEIYETSKVYGVGYAKQALEFAESRQVDLFAIMAHASEEHSYFGNVERSGFILNDHGVPVLCCNSPSDQ